MRVLTWTLGRFSAVTSAFIIQVHSVLQPDPTEETAGSSFSGRTTPLTVATLLLFLNGLALRKRLFMSKLYCIPVSLPSFFFGVPRDAWQTMVESICVD